MMRLRIKILCGRFYRKRGLSEMYFSHCFVETYFGPKEAFLTNSTQSEFVQSLSNLERGILTYNQQTMSGDLKFSKLSYSNGNSLAINPVF